jgi:hypothetical protein
MFIGRDRLQRNCASLLGLHFFYFQEAIHGKDKQISDHAHAEAGHEPGAAADDFTAGTISL